MKPSSSRLPALFLWLALGSVAACGGAQEASDGPALPWPVEEASVDPEVLGRFEAARAAFYLNSDQLDAWMHLGMTYEAHSYMALAIECYRAASAVREDAKTQHRLAVALAASGELQQAIQAIQRSIELDPDYAPSQLLLGSYLFDLGDFEGAYAAYEDARQLDPKHLGGAVGLARVELQRGAPQEAIRWLKGNLEQNPKEPTSLRLLHTAYLHAGLEAKADALPVKWHSLRSLGRDPWARELAGYAAPPVMEQAKTELSRGNAKAAIALLEPFIEAHPDETNALAHLAWGYQLDGRVSQGAALLDASLELYPNDLLLLAMKARSLESLGEYRKALAVCARMLDVDADHLAALERRARLFMQLHKPGQAIKDYQHVLRLDRSRMEVWLALGDAQAGAELWAAAEKSYIQALALKPGAEAPFVGRVRARWRLGDAAGALGQLAKRKGLGPEGRLLLQQLRAVQAGVGGEG